MEEEGVSFESFCEEYPNSPLYDEDCAKMNDINVFCPSACPICFTKASLVCEYCKKIFYCGLEVLKEHQSEHKEVYDSL